MSPHSLLIALTFGATLIGAHFHLEHRLARASQSNPAVASQTQEQLKQLTLDNEQLRRDNASLRALLTAEAPVSIPQELITFVENDLGFQFSTPPLALFANQDQLRDAAGQIWLAAFSEGGLQMRSYAFEKLGILPPNQHFMGQIVAAQSVGAIGVYDHSAGEILLAEHYDEGNVHHQAALVRLLAIALLENTIPLPITLSDDQFHTRQALHGGRASQLQERFYSLQARHLGFVDQPENTEALELFQSLAPYVQQITTFPNTFGKDYLAKLSDKQQVTAALTSNDLSTLTLLSAQTSALPPTLPSEHNHQLQTRLGALTVLSFLSQLESAPPQKTLAGFGSDLLTIDILPDQRTRTVWTIQWASPQNAQDFFTKAQTVASSMESPPEVTINGSEVTLTVLSSGADTE